MRYLIFALTLFALIISGCSNESVVSSDEPGKLTEHSDGTGNTSGVNDGSVNPPWSNTCDYGTMSGDWIRSNLSGYEGTFNGLWFEHDGDTIGYFHGTFWTTNDNQRLFSGELSGYITDQVIARLYGSWYYDDPRLCPVCGTGHGQFSGVIDYLDNSGFGMMKGFFGDYSQDPIIDTLPLSGK
ncbi:MAG: hypothetical protein GF310_06245, partial [candidate division Zixibacteria bacterium]|nr:hypothetical protein [candidate division Zixibacteria bacterium]